MAADHPDIGTLSSDISVFLSEYMPGNIYNATVSTSYSQLLIYKLAMSPYPNFTLPSLSVKRSLPPLPQDQSRSSDSVGR